MKKQAKRALITMMAVIVVAAFTTVPASASETKVRSLTLTASSLNLNVGSSKALNVQIRYTGDDPDEEITWSSSNSKVAGVSEGNVCAKQAGTAVITASMGGQSDSCTVTVRTVKPKWENTTQCYKLLNKYRKARHSKKIKPLKRDKKLEKIARIRAKEMAEKHMFSHTRPNGNPGLSLIKGRKAKGENIAMGQKTCVEVSKAWYASPSHRKNMMRKNFKKVGIAAYTYNGVTYWVEMFSSESVSSFVETVK